VCQPLIILGTGGSAHDLLDVVEAINARRPTWNVLGFLDDARPAGSSHLGLDVLGRLADAPRFPDCWFINVIGSDRSHRSRPEVIASTGLSADQFATVIHPLASVSSRARLGRGITVNSGVSVAGGVLIGDHVCLCPGVIVGHDAVVEDYALIAPGAIVSGLVRVGRSAYVGAGAQIRQRVTLGGGALVGMGAVVLRDVPDAAIVVGNPAQPLKRSASIDSEERTVHESC
jgi:sugar O-acyltransferase (sialic acid O-acetyltransferase NeuD family)